MQKTIKKSACSACTDTAGRQAPESRERMTSQKELVMEYLKSVKSHPSAEIIYKNVRKKLPHISQATVYRILNGFKEKGEIQEIDTKEAVFFDGDISDHAHFICDDCGMVFDVVNECINCGILKKKRTNVGAVKHYRINFYGTCKFCKKGNWAPKK